MNQNGAQYFIKKTTMYVYIKERSSSYFPIFSGLVAEDMALTLLIH